MFLKILIANRGEIAVRVIRACKEMGIATVAVYSEADREALHVSLADEAYCIGPAQSRDSYLNQKSYISLALATGCKAIHPGYGFLSENADFARLCEENGIVFIGPSAKTIADMGDKDRARAVMKEAGVPVIPGSDVVNDIDEARLYAKDIGYPLLIKARSGGGGRGIRLVNNENELAHAFNTATAEALSAFGDGAVYLEKFLTHVKHVEIQLLGDTAGNVVCLGDRDCSVQKRNQKLIEESPCSSISDATREEMFRVSIMAGKHVGYIGAGTIEYLCDAEGHFYFCEMNTRLQVEHPVTEAVTMIDIVKWQIRIAAGLPLSFTQQDIRFKGHAIECRINATKGGRVEMLHVPGGPWVRFDSAVYQGYVIPPFYDSMMGKLIVYAGTRDEAIRKMRAALCELIIDGVGHNAESQTEIISKKSFQDGSYTCAEMSNVTSKKPGGL